MSFTAGYHGPCANCDSDVQKTEVRYDGHDRIVHVTCPDPLPAIQDICPNCFLELPASGVCGVCE